MKITARNRKWIIGGAALLLTATPSFALFGIGDIVFDPTSYASLVSQLTTLQTQYTMLKNNIEHFSFKQQWQTTLHELENVNVRNRFGETNGMTTALNSNSPSASTASWTAATVPVSSDLPTYVSSQTPGSSQMAQLAMTEMSDAVSPDCLTAVGQYRSARSLNATANSSLTANQFDTSTGTNSEVQQLNLLNAAEAQKMTEMQSQGTMQACLASQMAVTNMQQQYVVHSEHDAGHLWRGGWDGRKHGSCCREGGFVRCDGRRRIDMWELWGHPIGGAIGTTRTARRLLKPVVKLFAIGVLIAGLIYAYVVFQAIAERSQHPHVHAHSTH